jgi:hypothetical protein
VLRNFNQESESNYEDNPLRNLKKNNGKYLKVLTATGTKTDRSKTSIFFLKKVKLKII